MTSDEIVRTLAQLAEATADARAATRDAHAAAKDVRKTLREHRDWLRAEIGLAVERHVGEITAEARAAMNTQVSALIDDIGAVWREKLGL